MYLVFFSTVDYYIGSLLYYTDNNFFLDDPPDTVFQKHSCSKYLQIVFCLYTFDFFHLTYMMLRLLFFTQKNKYRYLANSGNTVFSGEAKIQSQVSIGFLGIYYTVFTVFKGQKMVQTCTFLRSKKKPFKCS